MQNDVYTIGKSKIGIIAINKVIKAKLNDYDSFDVLSSKTEVTEENILKLSIVIQFKMNLKTYKPIIDMVESGLFNTLHYFASTKTRIQIRIK